MLSDLDLQSIPGKIRLMRVNGIKMGPSKWVHIRLDGSGGFGLEQFDPKTRAGFADFNVNSGKIGDSMIHINHPAHLKKLYNINHKLSKVQNFGLETICVTKGIEAMSVTPKPSKDGLGALADILNG